MSNIEHSAPSDGAPVSVSSTSMLVFSNDLMLVVKTMLAFKRLMLFFQSMLALHKWMRVNNRLFSKGIDNVDRESIIRRRDGEGENIVRMWAELRDRRRWSH